MNVRKIAHKLSRKNDCNKGDFGHALIVGGNFGMGGAAIMASESCARVGAGKTTLLTRNAHISALLSCAPHIMSLDENANDIFKGKNAVAIGPGLGQDDWSQKLFYKILDSKLPKIIDADALNLLAKMDCRVAPCAPRNDDCNSAENFDLKNAILTPHIGEAARLLNKSTEEIAKNRKDAAKNLYEKFGATIVLKGHGSIVFDGKNFTNSTAGNSAMATAGMGDILSGIIAGLLAQNLNTVEAAILGTEIHAIAGNMAAKKIGKIGIIPTDLLQFLPKILTKLM